MYFLQANLADYTENKQAASERRILITHWVGHVWDEMPSTMKGISSTTSKNVAFQFHTTDLKITSSEGLPDYSV